MTGLTNGTLYYCWALTESTVGYSSNWSKISNTVTPTATPVASVPVVEFYNTNLDNYFITADSGEAAAIDGGAAGPGWSRTGNTFTSGGSTSVCRFYGSQSPGPNSHFYTVDPAECQGLKNQQIPAGDPRKLTDKSWNFESLDFVSTPPTNQTCPGGTVPVYRAYNNGFTRGVDSNHRITTNLTAIQQQVACGWNNEGVVMCAPSGTTSGGTTSCGSAGGGAGNGLPKVELTNLPGATSAVVTKQKEASGTVINHMKVVSGEYLVHLNGTETTHGSIRITIPIEELLLPKDWNPTSFAPEYFDAATNTWKRTGSFIIYDAATKTLSFSVSIAESDLLAANNQPLSRQIRLGLFRWYNETLYRIRSDDCSACAMRTNKQLQGSNFIIHYFQPGMTVGDPVPANWNGTDGTDAPSYIQHMDTALNDAYVSLFNLTNSTGSNLMPHISLPQHVYVTMDSANSGSSPPGGPMSIFTRNIDDVQEMKNVAAHELVHVFQGHIVPVLTAGSKQWFMEASANHYSALVNNLSNVQKIRWYTDNGLTSGEYLSVPIDTISDMNHYTLAYFLDWLTASYGNGAIVGDILLGGGDQSSMDSVLKTNGEPLGISGAFSKYMAYFITHPEVNGGFNKTHKSTMRTFVTGQGLLKPGNTFNKSRTFISYEHRLDPLSST